MSFWNDLHIFFAHMLHKFAHILNKFAHFLFKFAHILHKFAHNLQIFSKSFLPDPFNDCIAAPCGAD